MEIWEIIFLSKWLICRFHLNLPGCTGKERLDSRMMCGLRCSLWRCFATPAASSAMDRMKHPLNGPRKGTMKGNLHNHPTAMVVCYMLGLSPCINLNSNISNHAFHKRPNNSHRISLNFTWSWNSHQPAAAASFSSFSLSSSSFGFSSCFRCVIYSIQVVILLNSWTQYRCLSKKQIMCPSNVHAGS